MDLKSLMKQAQEMQKKMQKIQDDLANRDYEGASGAGIVKVVINGAGLAKKISIDNSLLKNEEKETLEDLIIAAFNNAKNKMDEDSASTMKGATSGIPLPAGFKF